MKINSTTLVLILFFLFLNTPPQAEGAWWSKSATVLNDLLVENETKSINESNYLEIGDAFKEALTIASEAVVQRLGTVDGFNNDPTIHIPLPEELKSIKSVFSTIGMSYLIDDLELKLNRAAEAATPQAKHLFLQSIKSMTFEDIQSIYEGPEDSATQYFKKQMSPPLSLEMQPIVENTLSQVGAIQAYEKVLGQYKTLPFVPDVTANLSHHVIQKGMDGIFYYMAAEESSIRKDPLKQTTMLLKKVFGPK